MMESSQQRQQQRQQQQQQQQPPEGGAAAPPSNDESDSQPPLPAPRRFTGARAAALAAAAAPLSESREIEPAKSSTSAVPRRFVRQQVPDDILRDPKLAAAIAAALPANYDFEVPKTIWRLRSLRATRVALQFPEGLLLFSLALSDIILEFVPGVASVTVLGDVAYGACCVDDQGALACAGADALVHYGHSCLVPVQASAIPTLYVFVHISCDVDHLISTIELNFYRGGGGEEEDEGEGGSALLEREEEKEQQQQQQQKKKRKPIAIAGTVQFAPAVAAAAAAFAKNGFRPSPVVPQSRPLSPGEVLGCTAPRLEEEEEEKEEEDKEEEEVEEERGEDGGGGARRATAASSLSSRLGGAGKAGALPSSSSSSSPSSSSSSVDAIVFVADGRFHMEALMIANPTVPAFRYDPYSRVLTRERFDHGGMRRARKDAIARASREPSWGIVLGTLGRQGSREVLSRLVSAAKSKGKEVSVVLVSELSPAKLAALTRSGSEAREKKLVPPGGGGGGGEEEENEDGRDGGGRGGESVPFFSPPGAWAQVACPRLSIDWGDGFGGLPVLTPYEAMVSLGVERGWWVKEEEKKKKKKNSSSSSSNVVAEVGGEKASSCCGGGCGSGSGEKGSGGVIDLEGDPDQGHYPMDYYSSAGGSWAGTHHRASAAKTSARRRANGVVVGGARRAGAVSS